MASDAQRGDHGAQVGEVEYAVTHEIGHDVAHDHRAAFEKFEHAAGWNTQTKQQVRAEGGIEDNVHTTDKPTAVGDKLYTRKDDGRYVSVDRAAIPATEETHTGRWDYAHQSPDEHFAEVYAMAVQAPELLYADYVARPAQHLREVRAQLADIRARLVHAPPGSPQHQAALLEAQRAQQKVTAAEQAQAQRRALFDIMRNDVFGADKATRLAVARLRRRNLDAAALQTFEQDAARASTPEQVAQLEREAAR